MTVAAVSREDMDSTDMKAGMSEEKEMEGF
jgi:hypothetical protein